MAQQQHVRPIHPVLQHLNKRADPADLPRTIDIVAPGVDESTDDIEIDASLTIDDTEPEDAPNVADASRTLSKPVTPKLRKGVQFGLRSGI